MAALATPTPTSGTGIFGQVPGALPTPNPFASVAAAFPATQQAQQQGASNILSELEGQLSPQTLATIQNQGAAWGVQSGMPGSGVQTNWDLAKAAQVSQGEQQTGLQQYNSMAGNSSQYLTVNPALESDIQQINAIDAASPNPAEAGMINMLSEIAGMGWGYSMNKPGAGTQQNQTVPAASVGGGVDTSMYGESAGPYADSPDAGFESMLP
jgi:hypothetical protein